MVTFHIWGFFKNQNWLSKTITSWTEPQKWPKCGKRPKTSRLRVWTQNNDIVLENSLKFRNSKNSVSGKLRIFFEFRNDFSKWFFEMIFGNDFWKWFLEMIFRNDFLKLFRNAFFGIFFLIFDIFPIFDIFQFFDIFLIFGIFCYFPNYRYLLIFSKFSEFFWGIFVF